MSSVTAVPLQPVKKGYILWLWLGLVAAVLAAFLLAWQGTRAAVLANLDDEAFLAMHAQQPGVITTESGLQYKILEPGTGPQISENDGVSLTVQGELRDGTEFQPSAPMRFMVGQDMIEGFTEGVKLMRKGATYRFWLPPELGYAAGPGRPPNELTGEILIFDVAIDEVIPAAQLQQMLQGGMPGGAMPPPEVEGE
ncbi:FKBP-type peptidyl-prolyl cis-trans isomerase [Stakelama tenebrarum]|uniref:Peptidyl-prolyl cis-trans isomerase n=1 Tax=Stakelama tenebrarum TaxID=2711215 RepID=A0A6G6Y461_9SPHN|nr:FKBP-type peptidyl-prolyl cis-trans isomerase [Sphingosinithalassobacter tenebrarum]QIG79508.1 FKBP-type peptidylprolyl isomerase [Sphingosinithalassobacter tenebrarum]